MVLMQICYKIYILLHSSNNIYVLQQTEFLFIPINIHIMAVEHLSTSTNKPNNWLMRYDGHTVYV